MTPVELPNEWVVVWRPLVLGKTWVESYETAQGSATGFRFRMREDRPHPRLVLPLALVAWGAGLARTPFSAAMWVATRPLDECLAGIPDDVCLPVPCHATGRCEARMTEGKLTSALRIDELERVATAFTHSEGCGADALPFVGDWTDRWLRDNYDSVAVCALATVDRLRRAAHRDQASRALASVPKSETRLVELFAQADVQRKGSQAYVRYVLRTKTGKGESSCPLCKRRVVGSCRSCASYPAGPRRRDTVVDRLEVALGAR